MILGLDGSKFQGPLPEMMVTHTQFRSEVENTKVTPTVRPISLSNPMASPKALGSMAPK